MPVGGCGGASGNWLTWLLLAGRGFGKTRAAAEAVRALVLPQTSARSSRTLRLSAARSGASAPFRDCRHNLPAQKGRLLPIMVSKTDWNLIPSYLKAVTVLNPEGNAAAEAVAAVSRLSLNRASPGPPPKAAQSSPAVAAGVPSSSNGPSAQRALPSSI
jgi:hypothetical protein